MSVDDARKLVGAGFPAPLAKEIGRAIDAGSEDYRRLVALGVPSLLAQAMADAINGEDISAPKLASCGMNPQQARIFTMIAGLRPPAGFAFLVDEGGAYLDDENGAYLIAEEA